MSGVVAEMGELLSEGAFVQGGECPTFNPTIPFTILWDWLTDNSGSTVPYIDIGNREAGGERKRRGGLTFVRMGAQYPALLTAGAPPLFRRIANPKLASLSQQFTCTTWMFLQYMCGNKFFSLANTQLH